MVESSSDPISSYITESTAETRKVIYTWVCARSPMEDFISYEEGAHKKVSGVWEWVSLTHTSISKSGTTPFVTTSFTVNASNATVGKYAAGMTIYWQYNTSLVTSRGPLQLSISDNFNSPVYDSRY